MLECSFIFKILKLMLFEPLNILNLIFLEGRILTKNLKIHLLLNLSNVCVIYLVVSNSIHQWVSCIFEGLNVLNAFTY